MGPVYIQLEHKDSEKPGRDNQQAWSLRLRHHFCVRIFTPKTLKQKNAHFYGHTYAFLRRVGTPRLHAKSQTIIIPAPPRAPTTQHRPHPRQGQRRR